MAAKPPRRSPRNAGSGLDAPLAHVRGCGVARARRTISPGEGSRKGTGSGAIVKVRGSVTSESLVLFIRHVYLPAGSTWSHTSQLRSVLFVSVLPSGRVSIRV